MVDSQPVSKAEWDRFRADGVVSHVYSDYDAVTRMAATIDQLFEKIERLEIYRKRTRGMLLLTHKEKDADGVARELGIE